MLGRLLVSSSLKNGSLFHGRAVKLRGHFFLPTQTRHKEKRGNSSKIIIYYLHQVWSTPVKLPGCFFLHVDLIENRCSHRYSALRSSEQLPTPPSFRKTWSCRTPRWVTAAWCQGYADIRYANNRTASETFNKYSHKGSYLLESLRKCWWNIVMKISI